MNYETLIELLINLSSAPTYSAVGLGVTLASKSLNVVGRGKMVISLKNFWSTKDPRQQPFTFQIGFPSIVKCRTRTRHCCCSNSTMSLNDPASSPLQFGYSGGVNQMEMR